MKLHMMMLAAAPFFAAILAVMPFAEAHEWEVIQAEADGVDFKMGYKAGSNKPYRVSFNENGVRSVFRFGEDDGCVKSIKVGTDTYMDTYTVKNADDMNDVTIKLRTSDPSAEDMDDDHEDGTMIACDDCVGAWDAICDEGVPCVCNFVDFGAPFNADAEKVVEIMCETFGKACSADGGEEACHGQCM